MNQETAVFDLVLLLPAGERTIPVRSDQHIWDAAAAAGIKLPALWHQGRCLTCAGRLREGGEATQPQSARFPVDQSDSVALRSPGSGCGFRAALHRQAAEPAGDPHASSGPDARLSKTQSAVGAVFVSRSEAGEDCAISIFDGVRSHLRFAELGRRLG